MSDKVLNITEAAELGPNVEIFGDGDAWKLLCKASCQEQGWMKSTKVMQLPTGCMVQVTTETFHGVAEALVFVPGGKLTEDETGALSLA